MKALDEAHHTIALLREENVALEHALSSQTHNHTPLSPSLPISSHPSELAFLRDRVAYLEAALESAYSSMHESLGDLELDDDGPPPSAYPPAFNSSLHNPHFNNMYNSNPPNHYDYPAATMAKLKDSNSATSKSKTVNKSNSNANGVGLEHGTNKSTGKGTELDKRPPFISIVSPHSSRFAKPSDSAKLQIPKALPETEKPVIRIDLSSEVLKSNPKVKKKNMHSSQTPPITVTPVTITHYSNT